MLAYKHDLKGITVYRNNSRPIQPMNLETKKESNVSEQEVEELFEEEPIIKTVTCPECGTQIQMAEGCFICLNCGYSGCS